MATKFTELDASLSSEQRTSLHDLRDLEEYQCNDGTGFYFSDSVIFPVVKPEYVLAFFNCSHENGDCQQQLYTQTELWLDESLDNTIIPTGLSSDAPSFDWCDTVVMQSMPTKVTLLVECTKKTTLNLSYGPSDENLCFSTAELRVKPGESKEITLREGLQPGTTYFYALQEVSDTGVGLTSSIETFTTVLPSTCTADMYEVTSEEVQLHLFCSGGGKFMKFWFGQDEEQMSMLYDAFPISDGQVVLKVGDLSPATTYYFQWKVKGKGTGRSDVKSITTSEPGPCDIGDPPAVVLSRPTNSTIEVRIMAALAGEASLVLFDSERIDDAEVMENIALVENEVTIVPLLHLEHNSSYEYEIRYRYNISCPMRSEKFRFQTQRDTDTAFRFGVVSDIHWGDGADPEVLKQSLGYLNGAAVSGGMDFVIDLGDTFLGEKLKLEPGPALDQPYIEMFQQFSAVASSCPLFLVNGNHEGELGWNLEEGKVPGPLDVVKTRQRFFGNPSPDIPFYTGNRDTEFWEELGGAYLQNYYAWTWGDALFMVIDPFWYSRVNPGSRHCTGHEGWCWTLGEEQYWWLRHTLEASPAPFKFVFMHNFAGGLFGETYERSYGGGGPADPFAYYFEWGGLEESGASGFESYRPHWGKPIHQVLVENGVSVVFKGHDHLYFHENVDGVSYQTMPRPSMKMSSGSDEGIILGKGYNPSAVQLEGGLLEIEVSSTLARVLFRKYNGEEIDSYIIEPNSYN
uniref:Calcineurin-like phosphoesterase domain-containing protein n=1 Tax=Fibrocapsa japonica TaxID=94617 RepID=A0A7S2UVU7_9STRA